MPPTNPLRFEADDQFVHLLSQHQLRLRSYIYALVRDWNHADDVLQDAMAALWKKRHSYDSARAFFPWACGVALIEVLRFRRKLATDRLQFDESLINTLAVEYLEHVEEADRRRASLPECLKKLSERDRSLITARYAVGSGVAEMSASLGRPASTIYSSLQRIREALFRCIEQSLAQEGHPSSGPESRSS